MADKTKIEWTDATWNPIRGCTRVSEGCRNCYAEGVARRFNGVGLAYEGLINITTGAWNGNIRFVEPHLLDPLKWKEPRRIFVNSMSDLFHENVTDEMRDKIFAVMAMAPQHAFQILTKRPERMLKYFRSFKGKGAEKRGFDTCAWVGENIKNAPMGFPADLALIPLGLPNVWLGVSVENQKEANKRIPLLMQTPAAVRFLSCEPLLGALDLTRIMREEEDEGWIFCDNVLQGFRANKCGGHTDKRWAIDWVIAGGESGPKARPCDIQWIRHLVSQCESQHVPIFVKQLGSNPSGLSEGWELHSRKGDVMEAWPEDLFHKREFPEAFNG